MIEKRTSDCLPQRTVMEDMIGNARLRSLLSTWCARTFALGVLCFSLQLGSLASAEERTLIRAKQIFTADGDVIAPGEVLISDGVITYVGPGIELGLPAEEIEVHTLAPGFIDAASSAGLANSGAEVSREITPNFETHKAIDPSAREFKELLDSGVTTAHVLPSTESVFCGHSCIVKTAGADRFASESQSMVIAICSDPTSRNRSRSRPDSIYVRQPTNRMGVVWITRNTLHAVANGKELQSVDQDAAKVIGQALDGTLPVYSVSRTDFDIRSAMELGETYGFKPVIFGGDEIYRMTEEFKAYDSPLVFTGMTFGASLSALRGREGTDLRWNVPGQLADQEIDFCIAGDELLEKARFSIRFGLEKEKALKAITIWPAEILGISKDVGSIAVGKQADLVALTDDPMKPTSRVQWTMIAGKTFGATESK
ncbi:MAG: amidohydrolase family protein [Aureliella sp.]